MNAQKGLASLRFYDARNQALISIILISVIPTLSLFYTGTKVGDAVGQYPLLSILGIFAFTLAVAFSGFLILRKYPENILKLRRYITEIANGTLPEEIVLVDARNSDDIQYIEDSFKRIVTEMRARIEEAEERVRKEHALCETIERQQQYLLEAEQQRVMIQALGAACHHIGQPATVLSMELYLLRETAHTDTELVEIEECIKNVELISSILKRLREVSEYRTEPYVHEAGIFGEDKILVID